MTDDEKAARLEAAAVSFSAAARHLADAVEALDGVETGLPLPRSNRMKVLMARSAAEQCKITARMLTKRERAT